MIQLTINIEDKSMLPHLEKVLNALNGVSIVKNKKRTPKSGIDRAIAEIESGRVKKFDTLDALYQDLGI